MGDTVDLVEGPDEVKDFKEDPSGIDVHRAGYEHRATALKSPKFEHQIIVEWPTGVKNVVKFQHRGEWKVKELHQFCCKKLKLNPEDHYLVFEFKELIETEDVVKLGLKQNSVVKLFYGKKKSMTKPVRVSLAVNDVKISSLFKPTDNLWHIAQVLLAKDSFNPKLVPIAIYKKDEFIGEKAIRKVRLRELGVTSGTCALKLFQLKKEDLENRHEGKFEDASSQSTLQSLDNLVSTGVTDTGIKCVHFSQDDEISGGDDYLDERRAVAFILTPLSLDEVEIEDYLKQEYFDFTSKEISAYKEAVQIQLKTMDKQIVSDAVAKILQDEREQRKPDCVETVVRVLFPDNSALQALFTINETVGEIVQLVVKYTNYSENEFDLSFDPPPGNGRLQTGSALMNIGCVPCKIVYCIPRDPGMAFFDTFPTGSFVISQQALANETALMLRGDSLETFHNVDNGRFRNSSTRKYKQNKSSLGHITSIFKKSIMVPPSRTSGGSWDSNRPSLLIHDDAATNDEDEINYDKADYRYSRLRRQRKSITEVEANPVLHGSRLTKSVSIAETMEGNKSYPKL